ncbi:asparaginase [uncultured Roseobacter sp.]|uniref:asparaginase n=1 Tax=uncultured Roseobacter sp. TaxID=114847 RepID=UPI0026362A98|nr:asparaginase [uncultured Roseobacter sp.]
MTQPAPMVEIWRGDFLESMHSGHAVVCDAAGQILHAWGDPEAVVLPRSSAKMIQALPLITSGAARAARLSTEQLALACASHNGAAIHTDRVETWLKTLGRADDALRCGPQMPDNRPAREALIRGDAPPCQMHNNCSGKHTGFLTLARHLNAGSEYIEADHPVQRACLEAFETVTGESSPGFGIDGCSAPNYATTLRAMARAMAHFAAAPEGSPEAQLHEAMRLHPDLVAGDGRACTELMQAMDGRVAIKTGAEGFFTAILPERGLGVALKITDGTTRASECAMAAILVKLGALEATHPATLKRMNAPITNRRDVRTGWVRPAVTLS